MDVLFYSLFDIAHETDQSKPLFFYLRQQSETQPEENLKDVIEFADSTIQEADQLTKVRQYYFNSEETEVSSQIKKILNYYRDDEQLVEEMVTEHLQVISERYSRTEKNVIETKSNLNTPSPSNLFYVLADVSSDDDENNRYLFFVAKIEKSDFLHSGEQAFQLLKGLPHNNNGQKSDKNWKTASVYISTEYDENEELTFQTDEIIISDTSSSIATYWSNTFLEASEVTDDEKNTLQAYKEIKRAINNLNRDKNKTTNRKADINHFTTQLNGYFLNNDTFSFETMKDYVFGSSYNPSCPNLNIENFYNKISNLKDSSKFDNNFSIIQKVVEDKAKQTYKVSDKIDIRINKHINNISDIITSETDELGNPYIKIKVDSTENDTYVKFINRENNVNVSN